MCRLRYADRINPCKSTLITRDKRRSGDLFPRAELITPHLAGAFRGSMQHEARMAVSWCDDVARA